MTNSGGATVRVLRIEGEKYIELNAVGRYIDRVESICRPIVRSNKKWVPLLIVIDVVRDAANAAAQARRTSTARRDFELLERLEAAAKGVLMTN